MKSKELKKYLDFAYLAYQEHNISNQEYRQKGKVPYIFHPFWCSSMLIADTDLPFEKRELGSKALLLHDVLEDTSLKLPKWVEQNVLKIIKELTFKDWEDTKKEIPKKDKFIKLLELYDKLASMYEKHVGVNSDEFPKTGIKRKEWKKFVSYLTEEAEKNYGNIRIVQISKAIIKNTNW